MTTASVARSVGRSEGRRIAAVIGAGAVVIGAVLATGDTAVASIPVTTVADATVSCQGVSGGATFSPALRAKGTAEGLETVHLDLALTGCTSPALAAPATLVGHLTGSMTADNGDTCGANLTSMRYTSLGDFTVRWKAHHARIATTSTFAPGKVRPVKVRGKGGVTNESIKLGKAGAGGRRSSVTSAAGTGEGLVARAPVEHVGRHLRHAAALAADRIGQPELLLSRWSDRCRQRGAGSVAVRSCAPGRTSPAGRPAPRT